MVTPFGTDKLLIKPAAAPDRRRRATRTGHSQGTQCGQSPDSHKQHGDTNLATAPDRPTRRVYSYPKATASSRGAERPRRHQPSDSGLDHRFRPHAREIAGDFLGRSSFSKQGADLGHVGVVLVGCLGDMGSPMGYHDSIRSWRRPDSPSRPHYTRHSSLLMGASFTTRKTSDQPASWVPQCSGTPHDQAVRRLRGRFRGHGP